MADHVEVHRTLQGLFGLVVLGNAVGLGVVVYSLLTQNLHGGQLLATAVVVWFTERDRVRALVLDARRRRPGAAGAA